MIIQDVVDFAKLQPKYADITIDELSEDKETICFRQNGANIVETRYFDGSISGRFSFEILCKSKNKVTATSQLEQYKDLFDIDSTLVLTSNIDLVMSEASSDIRLQTFTEQNESVYSINVDLDYYERKV